MTGKPASGPESITELMPFSTPGMYSLGTVPPTTLLSKLKPSPGAVGSITSLMRANWPEPPVCFLCV